MNKILRCSATMQKYFQINPGNITKSPSLFLQSHGYSYKSSTLNNNPIFAEEGQFLSSSNFLLDELKKLDFQPTISERLRELVEYSVLVSSSRMRSLSMIYVYRNLKKNFDNYTEDKNIEKLYILAWCAEFVKVWTAVADDLVDDAKYRYGRETWAYKQPTPLVVVYDCEILRLAINKLLYMHFPHDKERCVEFFKIYQGCITGLASAEIVEIQVRAATKASNGKPGSLDGHKRSTYDEVTYYNTRYNTFSYPQLAAMTLAGERNEKLEKILDDVHVNLAKLYQEQDDISDMFVNPNWTGRGSADTQREDTMFLTTNSTQENSLDIHNGDFNSVLLTALEICSPEQKRVLEMNYGMKGAVHEQEVIKVFKELDIENKCKKRVAERCEIAKREIENIPNDVLRDTHYHLLDALMVKNDESYSYATS